MLYDFIDIELRKLKGKGTYRTISVSETPQEPRIRINNKECILLCSNNYLGLANNPKVKQAAIRAIERYGVGSGASRLVSGSIKPHRQLEERLAGFKGTEDAIVFNSGYHANLGVISALAGRGDVIFSDKLNHASIVDACILSRAKIRRYPHRDIDTLERFLKTASHTPLSGDTTHHASRKLIVTEGVFSMDGDIAPLKEILNLAEHYGAMVMVDDAHATGVLGENGRGTLEHLGIINMDNVIQMGTLGKAIGSFGAFVTGSKKLINYLINKSRTFIYTTALPPSVCAASIAAIDVIENEPELRQELFKKVSYFRRGLKDASIDVMSEESHIIPAFIGDSKKTEEVSRKLLEKGIFIQGIRPPTVKEGTARLRITLMATHEWEDLKYAIEIIKGIIK
ncbi:MAG: 8-amino-7-oxononanoate synthase [Deltaproteobacteria bacterium GWC2_42_11]|nr:MAG: 8-amino-7-oxononanoate synthase [Deltaproteobacteria bacterium GWC2_42_11]HBO85153.1 8-amino-7-oxononanoate synthase [Deltaproteobacteria bacterium]